MSADYVNTKKLVNIISGDLKLEKLSLELQQIALNNRVLFAAAKKVDDHEIIKKGDIWIKRLQDTLEFCNSSLGKDFDWVVIRTYKYIQYVTFDVDIFVPKNEFKEVVNKFKEKGCTIKSHDGSLGGRIPGAQVNAVKEGLLTIDLHNDFTWQKRQFLDTNLLNINNQLREISGVKVQIPSPEVELLLCMADITHERFNITLLDLIWLNGLSKEIKNWDLVFSQVNKYKWTKVFNQTAMIINGMCEDFFVRKVIPDIQSVSKKYSLPYFLPLHICWLAYFENVKFTKNFPFTSFLYMHYCKLRYILSNHKKMPYYDDWRK